MSQSVVKVDPEGGDSIDEFLEDFPTVTREQVISFLEEAKESVLAHVV